MKSPPPEVPVVRTLDGLAPRFRAALVNVLTMMPDAVVAETLRTHGRQSYLYGFGRDYDDGRGIVTRSHDADDTWHHYGLAADLIHRTKAWDAPQKWWRTLGSIAEAHGLTWGGRWVTLVDMPHVQWGPPMRRSPSPSASRLWAQSPDALWREVGAL